MSFGGISSERLRIKDMGGLPIRLGILTGKINYRWTYVMLDEIVI